MNYEFVTALENATGEQMPEASSVAQTSLCHIPELSFGDDTKGNVLMQGCNSVLVPFLVQNGLREKIKLVYLDPPYNNQESFTHYKDRKNHSDWLAALSSTLLQITELLTPDGTVWISIDDREMHYLKVAADEIFGRDNFVTTIIWQQRNTRENRKLFSQNHEYILVYAKDKKAFKKVRNLLPPTSAMLDRYQNADNDPRGPWQSVSAHAQAGHGTSSQYYSISAPSGKVHAPPNGRCWVYNEERMSNEILSGNIWFGKGGNGVPRIKKFMHLGNPGLVPETIWTADEVGTSSSAKKEILSEFPGTLPFDTPKPAGLIERIIHIASQPGDIVLDPFLGSGTTCVVAQRMERQYIGIEQGEQMVDFCVHRLRSEVEQMSAEGKKSGFKFYRLSEHV